MKRQRTTQGFFNPCRALKSLGKRGRTSKKQGIPWKKPRKSPKTRKEDQCNYLALKLGDSNLSSGVSPFCLFGLRELPLNGEPPGDPNPQYLSNNVGIQLGGNIFGAPQTGQKIGKNVEKCRKSHLTDFELPFGTFWQFVSFLALHQKRHKISTFVLTFFDDCRRFFDMAPFSCSLCGPLTIVVQEGGVPRCKR